MAMYKHDRTRVRSCGGSVSEWFGVNVGVWCSTEVQADNKMSVIKLLGQYGIIYLF